MNPTYPHIVLFKVSFGVYQVNSNNTTHPSANMIGETTFTLRGDNRQECLDAIQKWMSENNLHFTKKE